MAPISTRSSLSLNSLSRAAALMLANGTREYLRRSHVTELPRGVEGSNYHPIQSRQCTGLLQLLRVEGTAENTGPAKFLFSCGYPVSTWSLSSLWHCRAAVASQPRSPSPCQVSARHVRSPHQAPPRSGLPLPVHYRQERAVTGPRNAPRTLHFNRDFLSFSPFSTRFLPSRNRAS
jgi:hypothetical protein